MLNLQTDEYMEQMDSNVDDKMKVLQFIKGKKILDAGCGGGELTALLNWDFDYDAYGIDLSLLSYRKMLDRGLQNKFIHGNLLDMSMYFDEEEFDTVIFSSVLHEVYSYNGFHLGDIDQALENAVKIIPEGGRIIIRDGVSSANYERRRIRFKDLNDVAFLMEYCRRFKGRKIRFKQIDKLTYELNSNDAMEFLYTYTWGWDSFEREVQEQFGVMSLGRYVNLLNRIGTKVIHAEEYLQEGYNDYLLSKIDFFYEDMRPVELPSSTMIIVAEKI
jgi:SAM-dependent methyltransferase